MAPKAIITEVSDVNNISFHPLTVDDRQSIQDVTLYAGRRNCNYTFANLVGWQFWFNTEVCVLKDAVVLRFNINGERAYMVCTAREISMDLLMSLLDDSGGNLTLFGLEDLQAESLSLPKSDFEIAIEPRRNQFDYIYLRSDLAALHGGKLKAKRNHVNRFIAEYPHFVYQPLIPEFFDQCRLLTDKWKEDRDSDDTIVAERRVMETVFAHWDALDMIGGCIFIDGRMVAFTYGAAVTTDTIDVCVEKADRNVDGAFSIINQQFAEHLPNQFVYVNREEDMGLPGLRKAKMSYHPEILLSCNIVKITRRTT